MKEKQSFQQLFTVLENLPRSGCVFVDDRGEVIEISLQACKLLGIPQSQALGERWPVLLPKTHLSEVLVEAKVLLNKYTLPGVGILEVEYLPVKEQERLVGVVMLLRSEPAPEKPTPGHRLGDWTSGTIDGTGDKYTPFDDILGQDASFQKLKGLSERVAGTNATVLLEGESGSGKELFARAVHQTSSRRGEPFVQINCAAIPENLLESELFGYEEGAFTGALKGGKVGKFELADGGTIFLDEIGDMPLLMQAKLLHALQQKTIQRVGGTRDLKVDIRVIAATNQDLKQLIGQGKFRLDLYYRLAVIKLKIPCLRERGQDVLLLAQHIINKLNMQYGQMVQGINEAVSSAFLRFPWPGNIRELENVLEYSFNMLGVGETEIKMEHMPPDFMVSDRTESSANLEEKIMQAERETIRKALEATGGNKKETAGLLGIHRSGLYQKIKKYDLDHEQSPKGASMHQRSENEVGKVRGG